MIATRIFLSNAACCSARRCVWQLEGEGALLIPSILQPSMPLSTSTSAPLHYFLFILSFLFSTLFLLYPPLYSFIFSFHPPPAQYAPLHLHLHLRSPQLYFFFLPSFLFFTLFPLYLPLHTFFIPSILQSSMLPSTSTSAPFLIPHHPAPRWPSSFSSF